MFLKEVAIALLASSLIPIISRIITGDWLSFFQAIPFYIWAFSILIFFGIIIAKRFQKLRKEEDGLPFTVVSTPFFGWMLLGEHKYKSLLWQSRHPNSPYISERNDIDPTSIEIVTPPRCPKCKTEIEEHRSFWGGFIWKCINCGYSKRNWDSYLKEKDRVEKIVRRKFEEKLLLL